MSRVTARKGDWRRVVEAMAMPFDIHVVRASDGGDPTPEACEAVAQGVLRDLMWADDIFSLWRPDTPLSRVARGEITIDQCPPAVGEVLAECEKYREATGGFFDARRPDGTIDPTGIVKTWAVARAAWRLDGLGAAGWMVGASGDVLVSGLGPGLVPWNVGIADPRNAAVPQSETVLDVVQLGAGHGSRFRAVATSGTAQLGQHVWNPKTGKNTAAYLQVSVAGEDPVECDAWATAIVAGGQSVAEEAERRGMEVLCIPPLAKGAAPGGISAQVSSGWPSATT